MNIKEKCELYLRYKYEYYILSEPSISDYEFDIFEEKLSKINHPLVKKVTSFVDFPSTNEIKKLGLDLSKILTKGIKDEVKYDHPTPMLSLQKVKIKDESNMPYDSINLFLNRIKAEYIEGSGKYDGSSHEIIYKNNTLYQTLTRGDDGKKGLNKIEKIKHIVPNNVDLKGYEDYTIEIRGEMVIDVKLWEKKYSDPDKIDNARNYVAGLINRDDYNINEIKDLTFIAFSIKFIKDGVVYYPDNSMELLKKLGFNKKYEPFIKTVEPTTKGFDDLYREFKAYRERCPFLLDGFILKFPEKLREKLGSNNKYPKWALAIKFIPLEAVTRINDIVFELGKDGHLTPVAILEPVELLGTVVKRASLSNIGVIYQKKTYIGAIVSLVKSGEIIPMVTGVIEPSPYEKEYDREIEEFINAY